MPTVSLPLPSRGRSRSTSLPPLRAAGEGWGGVEPSRNASLRRRTPSPASPCRAGGGGQHNQDECNENPPIFHRPADFRRRPLGADRDRRRHRAVPAADQRISRSGAADRGGARHLSRRQPQGHRRDRGRAARAADQRRRGHALHVLAVDQRRRDDADRHVRAGHRPRQGAGAGAEPRGAGAAEAAAGGAAHSASPPQKSLARPDHGGAPDLAGRALRHALPVELRAPARQGRAGAPRRRRRRADVRRAATTACASGSIRRRWPSRQLTAGDVVHAIREQNVQVAAGALGCAAGAEQRGVPARDQHARPPDHRGRLRATSSCAPMRTAQITRICATSRASNWARTTTPCAPARQPSPRWHCRSFSARAPTPSQISDEVREQMAELKKDFPQGVDYQHRLRPDRVRARLDRSRGAHAVRGRSRWSCWW